METNTKTDLVFYLMKYILAIVAVFTIHACASYKGITLSTCTINGKKANHKILNRYPDYGYGHADGCLVLAEMKAALYLDKSKSNVSGQITDVVNGQQMQNVDVTVIMADSTEVKLRTDQNGKFILATKTPVQKITFWSVAYRNLTINL
jgi:hypothetical protein